MAKWRARAQFEATNWEGPPDAPSALAAATAQINAALGAFGWVVTNVAGDEVYTIGELVVATRQVGANQAVPDYGFIVAHTNGVAGDMQVQFADNTRRPMTAIVRRVV